MLPTSHQLRSGRQMPALPHEHTSRHLGRFLPLGAREAGKSSSQPHTSAPSGHHQIHVASMARRTNSHASQESRPAREVPGSPLPACLEEMSRQRSKRQCLDSNQCRASPGDGDTEETGSHTADVSQVMATELSMRLWKKLEHEYYLR